MKDDLTVRIKQLEMLREASERAEKRSTARYIQLQQVNKADAAHCLLALNLMIFKDRTGMTWVEVAQAAGSVVAGETIKKVAFRKRNLSSENYNKVIKYLHEYCDREGITINRMEELTGGHYAN